MKTRYIALLYLLCWVWLLCGCSTQRRDGSSIQTAGGVTVMSKGPVENPAVVDTDVSVLTLPLPAGSVVTVSALADGSAAESRRDAPAESIDRAVTRDTAVVGIPGTVTVKLSAPSELRFQTRREKITAPKNFAPPALPSASDLATAWGMKLFYVISVACLILGGLCIWRGHGKAGAVFLAAFVLVPCVARFFGGAAGLVTSIVLVCIGAALFVAWHLMRDKFAPPPALA
jgi:hypothetical protein